MHPGDETHEPPELRVTDRRRFTETGDVREGGETAAPEPAEAAASREAAAGRSRAASDEPVSATYERAPRAAAEPSAQRAPSEGGGRERGRESDGPAAPGVFDLGIQAVFYIFWQSAMVALGAGEPGSTAPAQVDLGQARESIALLKLLEEKTAGNLDAEESETLRQLLHDAQLRYVQVARAMGGGA